MESLEAFHMASINPQEIKVEALEMLSLTNDNAIRISCYKEGDSISLSYETRFSRRPEVYKVTTSKIIRYSNNTLLNHKSSCHLNNYIEKISLSDTDIDEMLHYNEEGHLTEGIYTNVFFVKDNVLYTPAINCGILPGISRQVILETAKKLDITVKIGYYSSSDISQADEMFLSNALIKLVPVKTCDDIHFNMNCNKITQLLMKEIL